MNHHPSSILEDFVSFKKERSAEAKERLARKLCLYLPECTKKSEKAVLRDILFILSCDMEIRVRQALSDTLKSSADLPHEVALRLARDIEEVAAPVLEHSEALTDEDLEDIIRSTQALGKLHAIAKRRYVSPGVSTSLIATEEESVVKVLIANNGAEISCSAVDKLLEIYGGCDDIMGLLIRRGGLSIELVERMATRVSGRIRDELAMQHGLSPRLAQRVAAESHERVVLGLLETGESETNTLKLVDHLHKSNKLTHTIVMRALCRMDMEFFEASLARLAGVPIANAHKLLYEPDRRAFQALYESASLPDSMMEAAEILVRLIAASDQKRKNNPALCSKDIMRHIADRGYDRQVPNMRYFLTLIGSFAAEEAAGQRRMLALYS